ncbi:MAG: 3'-5' exonuclease [Chloroflexi bacterium]|nr:3'-5' exonuclease [Chloroflexota bacterium]
MSEFASILIIIAPFLLGLFVIWRLTWRKQRGRQGETRLSDFVGRKDVLILDTETTGLYKSAEILEIAIIDTTGTMRYSAPVMPKGRVLTEASDIHGLTRRELRKLGAQPWPDHHHSIASLLEGAVVIGWNIDFDVRMLHQTCDKYDLEPPVFRILDLLAVYRERRKRRRNRLTDAIRDEGLATTGDLHRAETDCRAVLAVLRKLAADVAS